MTGMAVQRMAVADASSGSRRLKSIIAITPVAANGYPADEATKRFLWELIHERALSEHGFSLLTGQRLTPAWGRAKAARHLHTSSPATLRGYYRMWLETDFSRDVRDARISTPMLVIGGRQDLPGFQEEHLRRTFGAWYPNIEFTFIAEAGHYPMQETPVYLASLIESFLGTHRHDS
jgi:pimeloyl-ACP methyl ester carboxylesterase